MTHKNESSVGKAYAFLDHDSEGDVLVGLMERNQREANFPDTLSFTVLDDKLNDMYDHERKRLPAKIAEVAEATDVYCNVPMSMVENLSGVKPKKAADLRYVIMAQDPEVTDHKFGEPLGQGRANEATAGMLNEVLIILCRRECQAGQRNYLRKAVFYQDSRGRAQRYL